MNVNTMSQVLQVPIEDIIPNRFQPRLNFDDSSLNELAASIKQHGIIQPLVLRKVGDKYEIIAGERRYKASKLAGLTSVPAIINDLDDQNSAEVAIVENIQRKDLSAIEEAKSYKALLDKGYITQEELAKKMGISQSAISNKLRLLSLTEDVQNALMEGKISARHARSLLQVNDPNKQIEWLSRIINERLTVKDLEKKLKGDIEEESSNTSQPIININPNIQDIINNATDIIDEKKEDQLKVESTITKPMANKFFNSLEDESVNMHEVIDDHEEEIEMLDIEGFDISKINKEKYDNASLEIKKAIDVLKSQGLNIEFTELDTDSDYKINIIIKKDE